VGSDLTAYRTWLAAPATPGLSLRSSRGQADYLPWPFAFGLDGRRLERKDGTRMATSRPSPIVVNGKSKTARVFGARRITPVLVPPFSASVVGVMINEYS